MYPIIKVDTFSPQFHQASSRSISLLSCHSLFQKYFLTITLIVKRLQMFGIIYCVRNSLAPMPETNDFWITGIWTRCLQEGWTSIVIILQLWWHMIFTYNSTTSNYDSFNGWLWGRRVFCFPFFLCSAFLSLLNAVRPRGLVFLVSCRINWAHCPERLELRGE